MCSRESRAPAEQAQGLERVAVFHRHKRVFRPGLCAETDVRAAAIAQFEMASDEIGVEVGEKDVADLHARGVPR